jgi:choice-of-anchor B domain-containing protein
MLRSIATLALLGALPALAHEDDPKLLDRQPPHPGPGWTLAATRDPGGAVAFGGGATFAASGVQLLSWISLTDFGVGSASGNDCWGYTSPSGRRYALMGLDNGTAFVEITDPLQPVIVAVRSGPTSLWRDIKVYAHHAYVVSEGGGGIQVFDLSPIDSGVVGNLPSVLTGGTSATHNVAIDVTSGFLYRCGGSDEGLRIYSLANPAAPQLVSEWPDRYVHDAQVITYTSGPYAGRQIAFACSGFNGGFVETAVDVLDVTDKQNIVSLSRESWPAAAYSHQAWLSEDLQYLYVNDELDENGGSGTRTIVLDVSDLQNATYLGSFSASNTAVGHNLYTAAGRLFEANYRSGLRVYDVSQDPLQPPEVAFFDTYPADDEAQFNGLWSCYPYFGDGIVIGSDLERGLFVWYVGPPKVQFVYPGGAPEVLAPSGASFEVQLLEATAGDLLPGSERLYYDDGTGYRSTALVPLGQGLYRAEFGALPCGASVPYYLSALSTDGLIWNDPEGNTGAPHRAPVGLASTVLGFWDMESSAGFTGGAPGDSANTGQWTRVDPLGTVAAPADDHTPAGTMAWVTGQGTVGGSSGQADVDNGHTTLLSPLFDLAGHPGSELRYWRWYSNQTAGTPDDVLDVDLSPDGGSTWFPVERLGPTGPDCVGGWREHRISVGAHFAPTAQVRLRVVARDLSPGSIVEAGLDDLTLISLGCPDCDGNGIADGLDALAGALDLDQDFVPDSCEALVGVPVELSVAAGGSQQLTLRAGSQHAGDVYLILGSASGSEPGFPLDGVTVPLLADAYTLATLSQANLPPFVQTVGLLDGQGQGGAAIQLPAGTSASLAGLELLHAYPVIDTLTLTAVFASNPAPLRLVP